MFVLGVEEEEGYKGLRMCGERVEGSGEKGTGTLSVSSVKKYQRAATRPPPGTVKNLISKFQ